MSNIYMSKLVKRASPLLGFITNTPPYGGMFNLK